VAREGGSEPTVYPALSLSEGILNCGMDDAREWVDGANATRAARPRTYGELDAGSRNVCFARVKKSARGADDGMSLM
jgi:hypothetical protein